MLTTRSNGALVLEAPLYEKAEYDMSNLKVLAQSDGCFSISKYAVANRFEVFEPGSFYAGVTIDGQAISGTTSKIVRMLGRQQEVELKLDDLSMVCETFMDERTQAVFQQFSFQDHAGQQREARIDFGFIHAVGSLMNYMVKHRFAECRAEQFQGAAVTSERMAWGACHKLPAGWRFDLASSESLILREIEGAGIHYSVNVQIGANDRASLQLVYRLRDQEQNQESSENMQMDGSDLLKAFAEAKTESEHYQSFLTTSMEGHNELEKAMFAAALNCGISSYKEMDGFKGLFAGINYQSPARTYYRDGYYTALPLLPYRPSWVRNQILTLALGIDEHGRCPSAVMGERAVFWPDHKDSPCYFIMLVHDYLVVTQDASILAESSGGRTVMEWIRFVADALLGLADGEGLLWREAGNRHDWADNVYREGYITYVEALFYRSIYCTGKVVAAFTDDSIASQFYLSRSSMIKEAINRLLWDDEKGYYVNYQSDQCRENHLSIDTILTVWFGIADEERSRSVMTQMELLLETINNKEQPFGDWGVMCCYPAYQYKEHLVEKSSYDYVYHNGSDWPYLTCLYALVKLSSGMNANYPLTAWFRYGLEHNWCTPVEYYNPITGRGSYLQGWSAMGAAAIHYGSRSFAFEL
ncbi:amylo-alpha-1,6-glucosidase [Paenibacillus sp. strain BS8-2]